MAGLRMEPTWHLTLNTEELRLVLKALGGRLKEEDVPIAKKLGDSLTRVRAETMIQQGEHGRKLLFDVIENGD